jgi:hypothetical protein
MDISAHMGSSIQQHASLNQEAQPGAAKKDEPQSTHSSKKEDPFSDPTSEESVKVRELQARDREVRAHEAAHLNAAGSHAKGGATFTYQQGPDGRLYAVGGEVSIDTSPVSGNPEATLAKAETIRRAALAPATPSSQDRSVAARAGKMAIEARADIQTERVEAKAKEAENSEEVAKQGSLKQRIEATGATDTEPAKNPANNLDAFI